MGNPKVAETGEPSEKFPHICDKCQVQGGKLDPCLPDDWLRELKKTTGRPCPFIELAPQNDDAYFLATLRLSEDAQPFLTPVGITFGLRHEWKDVRVVWARLARALKHPDFLKAWEEWRELNKTPSGEGDTTEREDNE